MWTLLAGLALATPRVDVPELDGSAVTVDGRLDEAVWAEVEPITEFLKYQPNDGGPPPGSTEVRIFHDDRALYIGVRVRDSAWPVRARVSARERINADDQIGLYFDPFAEGGSGYIFYLNAIGIQQDMRVLPGNYNMSWDTVFRSKGTVIDGNGYDLEVVMPFRSLKYPSGEGPQDWRLIITRKNPAEGAKYAWPQIERNVPRVFTQGGVLTLDPPDGGSGLEVRGELAVLQTAWRDPEDQRMRWSGLDAGAIRPGLDVKYGLTPNIGLGATVNPDFSQVENDETPINVNQRFAFFFSERRPFFLDGAGYFADRSSTLYSRSIVNPVYGLKTTGREGRVALGVLHALDRTPAPSVHQYGAPGFAAEDVDGAVAANTVGRFALDVLDGGHLGVTVADKRLYGNDGLRGSHEAMTAQLFTPIGSRWTFGAHSLHTLTGNDAEQLYGHAGSVALIRQAAAGFGTQLSVHQSTPGVRQETGFRTQSGLVEGAAGATWTFEPKGIVDTLTPGVSASVREEDEGDRYRTVQVNTSAVVGGLYNLSVRAGADSREEQGLTVPGRWVGGGLSGDVTRWFSLDGSGSFSRTIDWRTLGTADRAEGSVETTLRPTAGIRVDTIVRHDRLLPLDDSPIRWASSVRSRLTWQFTQQLGLRLIGQHVIDSEQAPLLTSSVLFTWLQHPGTAVYVGYAETTAFGDKPEATHRTVFAKGTVLLRL